MSREEADAPSVDVTEPALLIRIPKLYRTGMSARALYDATRGVWRIGTRRGAARLALAVHQGIVQEVYEIEEWLPAGSTEYDSRGVTRTSHPGRWEFVGKIAPELTRGRYIGRSVAHYFRRGSRAPVRYINIEAAGQ